MHSRPQLKLLLALAVLAQACSGNTESRPRAIEVIPTGALTSALATTDDGGTLVLTTDATTYVLDIPADALAVNTVITMEEVAFAGGLAVRFSPDGLTFATPATLTFDRAYDRVLLGLQFTAGEPGVEMQIASPTGAQTAMLVHHFSEGALTDPETAAPFLTEEQREQARFDADETAAAQGLFARYMSVVLPALGRARFREVEVDRAIRTLTNWRSDVALAAIDAIGVSTEGRVVTFAELAQEARDQLVANATALYRDRTAPLCIPGRDVFGVVDWARVTLALQADLALLEAPVPATSSCFVSRIVLTGPPQLAATDDTVTVNARYELADLNGVVELAGRSVFDFAVTGADQPDSGAVPSTTGAVTRVLTRPATNRSLGVRVVATAFSTDTQLGGLPPPPPAELVLQESVELELDVSVPLISEPSGTSVICATASSQDLPVFGFEATFTLMDALGSLSSTTVVADPQGRACVTYTAPDELPSVSNDVAIRVDGNIKGAFVTKVATVRLEGDLDFAVTKDPAGGIELVVDASRSLCVVLTADGAPEVGATVGFGLSGPGQLDGGSATTDTNGRACRSYTAPSSPGSATVTTAITARGQSIPNAPSFAITIVDAPEDALVVVLSEQVDMTRGFNSGSGTYNQHEVRAQTASLVATFTLTPTSDGTGYVASDVVCGYSGSLEVAMDNVATGEDWDSTQTFGPVVSCTVLFSGDYPAQKRLTIDVTYQVHTVTTGVHPVTPDVIGTFDGTGQGFFGIDYSESGGALVFDDILLSESIDLPEDPPNDFGTSDINVTASGSLPVSAL